MQIEHIAYVVKNIDKSLVQFEKLGYEKCSTFFNDEIRKVKIIFIKNGTTKIELVEPMDETSDAYAYYKRIKNGPYHICYEVVSIDECVKELLAEGYIVTKEKEKAVAFSDRPVCFLYNNSIGLIELVEK